MDKSFYTKISILLILLVALCLSTNVLAQTRFKSLNYLYSITGSKTLSGQHNDQKDGTNEVYWTNRVHQITGKYPALWGGDFLFHGNSSMRWAMTYEAERQWNRGAVVNIMWHACPPTQGAVCNWDGGLLSSMNSSQWSSLLTNGGALNNTWKQRIDEIAPYLQYLQSKGVEVLWRPLHEQNQTAFWWNSGGAGNTKALWRLTHDYMTNVKGLKNLIWVWDVQDLSTNFADYNPGSSYFDIAALDVYADGFSNLNYYNALVQQAAGKPVVIGENFKLPNATQLNNLSQMSFFMTWAYGLKVDLEGNQSNSDDYIREVYNNPRVITLDEMPGWNSVPDNLARGKTVTVNSTEPNSTNYGSNAVDGNYSTRWSSAYADPQWIYVDLGATYNVNRVKITWEAARARDYYIEVSSDRSTWTNIKTVAGNSTNVNDNTNLSGTGRYVRIYGTARATSYGYSIWELEVYGTSTTAPNLALNRPVTTTTNESTATSGPKAVDGNTGSRWSSQYLNNQNFIVDLGTRYNINRVKINWEAAYAKDYQIQIAESADGPWPNIKEVYGKTTSATDDWKGLSGTGRYLKVYCINRATQYGFSIWELEAYGTPAGSFLKSASGEESENNNKFYFYPNPFSEKTTLSISVPEKGHTLISVFGILGNKIKDLHDGELKAGVHEFEFNGSGLPAGIYTYSVWQNGQKQTKKLLKH